jgi:hypothetical protein
MADIQHPASAGPIPLEPPSSFTPKLYADVAEIIAYGPIKPPAPTIALRSDGVGLFYEAQVNMIFGDPESGKTLLAQCAAADELFRNRKVLIVDLDHNGAHATVSRFQSMGVKADTLADPRLFRYAEPEDHLELDGLVRDASVWQPDMVVIDSVGELLPVFAASSNSADDFTRVHARAIKPFAKTGAAVVVIDHLAKGSDSRSFGSTGTAAKKRAIGGTMLRVVAVDQFSPGHGGRAEVTIAKDRHGGLRTASPSGREPLAAKFVLTDRQGALHWRFEPPAPGEMPTASAPVKSASQEDDVAALDKLDPPPRSKSDVAQRMTWGNDRAMSALRAWRELRGVSAGDGPLRPVQ